VPAFSEPWFKPDAKQAAALEREVALEVGPDHELHGHAFTTIAKCGGCDRVVFMLDDESRAMVHLTWSGKAERAPWPETVRMGGYIATEIVMDDHQH
jgi:hypothetical protein